MAKSTPPVLHKLGRPKKVKLCPGCGKTTESNNKFCSITCQATYIKHTDTTAEGNIVKPSAVRQVIRKLAKNGWNRETIGEFLSMDANLLSHMFLGDQPVTMTVLRGLKQLLTVDPPHVLETKDLNIKRDIEGPRW